MLTFTAPTSLSGAQLTAELVAAGYLDVTVTLVGAGLNVTARTAGGSAISEQSRSKIQGVLDAHTPNPDFGLDTAALDRRASKARMRELYGKGWNNLTTAEKAEIQKAALALLAE